MRNKKRPAGQTSRAGKTVFKLPVCPERLRWGSGRWGCRRRDRGSYLQAGSSCTCPWIRPPVTAYGLDHGTGTHNGIAAGKHFLGVQHAVLADGQQARWLVSMPVVVLTRLRSDLVRPARRPPHWPVESPREPFQHEGSWIVPVRGFEDAAGALVMAIARYPASLKDNQSLSQPVVSRRHQTTLANSGGGTVRLNQGGGCSSRWVRGEARRRLRARGDLALLSVGADIARGGRTA